ncbi:Membrane protein involved in the export of O-antigen and teichoic acid [Desulfosarcina cetonica]|nr:Membrane protein involved in the export of O-antigen and teichoic acid [Desulfosarcina cetonica]
MLSPIAGFGIGPFWLKVFGLEGWQGKRWLIPSLQFVCISSLMAVIILYFYSRTDTYSGKNSIILWLLPLIFAFVIIELVTARLQLEERYTALSLWQMIPQAGRLVVALAAIFFSGELYLIGAGFFILALVIIFIGLPFIIGMVNSNMVLAGHDRSLAESVIVSPTIPDVFHEAWPFAIAGFSFLIYFQSDLILLRWMRGAEAAGQYNAAYTIMVAVYMLPSVVYQKYLLPKQHRWAEHDRERFITVYRFGCGVMLITGLIVMAVLLASSLWAVPLVFGNAYFIAGRILLLLSICVPVHFLATSVGGTLVTQNHMRHKVRYMGIAAVVNIILNILLIPVFSYYGAAAATVVSETLILAIYLVAVKKRVFGADAWRGWTLRFRPFHHEDEK